MEPDPHHIDCDYIGPVSKESNLREIVRHIPKNETPLQKQLRTRRISVHKWNTEFWTNHNKRFYEVNIYARLVFLEQAYRSMISNCYKI